MLSFVFTINPEKISCTAMKLFLKMLCASFILIWNLANLPIQELMGKRWLHYSLSSLLWPGKDDPNPWAPAPTSETGGSSWLHIGAAPALAVI
uniref:Uncharacterized protein n=1 Tax=Oryctolagus cuniculus TaxID=9986 RepID=A0A5F9CD93_RABIT